MAKVILMAGIMSLRGKIGKVYYKTLKDGQVLMCRMPKKSPKAPSEAQKRQQERFAEVVKQVGHIMRESEQREAMELLYRKHGKRNELFRSFLFRVINQTMEEKYESML